MSEQTIYAALVRALRDARMETAVTARRKALNRVSANKDKLFRLYGGMTPEYLVVWERARNEAGYTEEPIA